MKKIILLMTFIPVVFTSVAYAESSASVEINNNVNSSSNSNSSVKTHTDITVETDGKTTHYESDEPGSVSVKSVNGESEIKVNGEKISNSPKPTSEISKNPSPVPTKTVEQKVTENQILEVIEKVKEKINELERKLSSFFD